MNTKELKTILYNHKIWLETNGKDGEYANLQGADLYKANLFGVDLCDANLQGADLRGANLRDANIDFSCWPLWCGSQHVIIDERQARQLLAHALNLATKFWPGGLTDDQKQWLNDFHQIKNGNFDEF